MIKTYGNKYKGTFITFLYLTSIVFDYEKAQNSFLMHILGDFVVKNVMFFNLPAYQK